MRKRGIVNAGILLGLVNIAVVISYLHSGAALLAGVSYLMVAGFLGSLGITTCAISKAPKNERIRDSELSLEIRSRMLVLVAWQVSVLGILGIFASKTDESNISFGVSYFLTTLFVVCSYRLVSIADCSAQEGGYIPLNFLGVPRARRFVFSVYAGGWLLSLIFATLERAASGVPRHGVLEHPNLCLLATAVINGISSALIYERYRKSVTQHYGRAIGDRAHGAAIVIIATFGVVAATMVMRTVCSYGLLPFTLSTISFIGCAVPISCLWKIGEIPQGVADPLPSPRF